jgi:hypothetical protein
MFFYRIPQRVRSKKNNQVHKKGKISAEINYFYQHTIFAVLVFSIEAEI